MPNRTRSASIVLTLAFTLILVLAGRGGPRLPALLRIGVAGFIGRVGVYPIAAALAILFGIGIDFGIYLIRRTEEEREAGHSLPEAVGRKLEIVPPDLVVGHGREPVVGHHHVAARDEPDADGAVAPARIEAFLAVRDAVIGTPSGSPTPAAAPGPPADPFAV